MKLKNDGIKWLKAANIDQTANNSTEFKIINSIKFIWFHFDLSPEFSLNWFDQCRLHLSEINCCWFCWLVVEDWFNSVSRAKTETDWNQSNQQPATATIISVCFLQFSYFIHIAWCRGDTLSNSQYSLHTWILL